METMPLILKQLLGSEKFLYVALLFMGPLTVMAFLGMVTVEQWRHDAFWSLSLLIGGKTVQGATTAIASAIGSRTENGEAKPGVKP